MKAYVNIYSTLRHHFDPRPPLGEPIEISVEPEEKMSDLIEKLGLPVDEVAIIMVNHNHASKDDKIEQDNARIALFPVSGGG